jgi:hypothetical protein
MRCLAKACAMHGLGAYVYMGEDLPPEEAPAAPARPASGPSLTPAQRELLNAINERGIKYDAVPALLGDVRLADLSDAAAGAILARLATTTP